MLRFYPQNLYNSENINFILIIIIKSKIAREFKQRKLLIKYKKEIEE